MLPLAQSDQTKKIQQANAERESENGFMSVNEAKDMFGPPDGKNDDDDDTPPREAETGWEAELSGHA